MANIIDMADARIKIRDQMADQIRHADKDADANVEADKLLVSFAKALEEAPLAQEEKLLALYMKLIETLMSLADERDRNRYAQIFEKHLRENIVEAVWSENQRVSDESFKDKDETDDQLRDLTDEEWFP